ncbi:MAG: reverse transcriptase domain-containing protein [Candidatus Thiodiazotropha sp.]
MKDEYDFDSERFTHDYYEYEQGQKHIIVKGRLKKNITFWQDIGASAFVLDVIENGYKIPLFSLPPQYFSHNNRSAMSEQEFVSEAIKDLLDRSLIEECESPPRVVNPLTVSQQSSGKKRLILDLRIVNQHIWKQSVKYDDLKIALSYLQKGFHMIKFDITSAYHFIEIFPPHTEFLGFSWTDKDGKRRYYKFLVLPFGLSSACYLFSKITRPLVAKWRGEGKMILMYLDDGFGCAKSFSQALEIGCQVKFDLLQSGFIPKAEKSIWEPVQVLDFLGCTLNAKEGTIFIPEHRILKAQDTISELLSGQKVHRRVAVRKVASFVGQVISMSIVIGHISQIMTRYLSIDILKAFSWDSFIPLSCESIEQLKFWKSNLQNLNIKDIYESHKCTKIVYSDASSTGFAGYEVNTINGISHGVWSPEEGTKSSTWRELMAVCRTLKSLGHVLSHQSVKWFSDNQGVTTIVRKGSMKQELQDIAFEIFNVCICKSIHLHMEWIPRSENSIADYFSRIEDHDDWGISVHILHMLQCKFGTLSIDWFASDHNAKLARFFSRFWNPFCLGVDAFTETWTFEFGLFVPPITLVTRVIKKMIVDRATGVLVIPCWRSAPFWPILCPDGKFIPNVIDWFDLPTSKEFYTRCKNGRGMFGNADLKFRMLALKMNFQESA